LNTKALRKIGREVETNASNTNTGRDVEEKALDPGGVAEAKKAGKKRLAAPNSTSTIRKKRSNCSTVKDGTDVLDVPSPVAYQKASMLKLQHESWCYDFSAQVPADFKIKGKTWTPKKGKKFRVGHNKESAISVASSNDDAHIESAIAVKTMTWTKVKAGSAIDDAGEAVSVECW